MKNSLFLAIILATTQTLFSCENSKKEPQKEVTMFLWNKYDTLTKVPNSLLLEEGDTCGVETIWKKGKPSINKMVKTVTEYLADSVKYTHGSWATFEDGCRFRKSSGVFLRQGVVIK